MLAREAGSRAASVQHRDLTALLGIVDRAMEIGRRLDDPEVLALPLALHGVFLMVQGQRREAIPVLEQAVDLLEQFVVNEASFYAGELAIARAQLGEFPEAMRVVARARALADRSEDPRALADADIFEATILGLQGRHDDAIAMALRGRRTAEEFNEVFCQSMACLVAGDNQLALDQPMPAIKWLQEATDLAVRSDADMIARMSGASLQAARAMAGEGPTALDGMDVFLEQARAAGDALDEGQILLRRAQIESTLAPDDQQLARADAVAAMAIFERLGTRPYFERAEAVHRSLT